MKNTILKILGVIALIIGFLITSLNISANASTSKSVQFNEFLMAHESLENNMRQQELSQKIHHIINSYKNDNNNLYPSFYGGLYISDDSLSLVIPIVEKNIPKKSSKEYNIYNEIINMYDTVKIEYVKYSLNELNEINNDILDNLTSIVSKTRNNLSSNYVDIINNTVAVELVDNSAKQQENFRESIVVSIMDSKSDLIDSILNSESIKFSQATYSFSATELRPGGAISVGGRGCSMGFRTRLNGKNGYMTAGHCARDIAVGKTINTGTLRAKQWANNQNYDYAFIETFSTYAPSNTLRYFFPHQTTLAVLNNACPPMNINMMIGKSGRTTEYASGQVIALNATLCSLGICVKGLVKSSAPTVDGDSGGPVYSMRVDSAGGPLPLGIVSGGSTTATYFTSIDNLPYDFMSGRY